MSEPSRAAKKSESNFDKTIVIALQNDNKKATNAIESFFKVK